MSWAYNPSAWVDGVTIPMVADFQAIYTDIHTWGGSVDAGGYVLADAACLNLNPGVLPGTAFSVSAATWSGGTATLTIGTHSIQVGQHVVVTSITPTGYNSTDAPVTATTGTQIKYAVVSNPGAYSSGGTVTVGIGSPATGSLAVDVNGNLNLYGGSGWVQASSPWLVSGANVYYTAGNVGIGGTPSALLHLQSSGGLTECLIQNTNSAGFALLLLQNNTPQKYQIAIGGSGAGAPYANSLYFYDATNAALRFYITSGGNVAIPNLASYANNAAAISGGLTAGMFYLVTSSNPRQAAIVF